MLKWHPLAERLPLLEGDEWERFKEDIAKTKGPEQPVLYRLVKGDRQGLDGRNRYIACEELGIECPLEKVDVEDDEVFEFVLRHNVLRRHLNADNIKSFISELRQEGKSTRSIARDLGISHSTVARHLNGHEVLEVQGRDGKKHPAKKSKKRKREREPGDDHFEAGEPGHGKDYEPVIPIDDSIPKKVRNALADTWHLECAKELERMIKACKSAFHWSVFLDAMILEHLKRAKECFMAAAPKKICDECDGHGCSDCRMSGYLASQV